MNTKIQNDLEPQDSKFKQVDFAQNEDLHDSQ